MDVASIMETWTGQMGYPVLTLSREQNVLKARQQRFLFNQNTVKNFTDPKDESRFGCVE